jgi:hypothetical protein
MLPVLIRKLLRAFTLVAFVLLAITLRVMSSARAELQAATAAEGGGDIDGAIVHYRRAARWYAPGSPYHRRALERLGQIGTRAEAQGELELALSAYRSVRGACLATRSFYVPEAARLHAANARIAALMAELPPPGMDAGKSKLQLTAEHLALLEVIPGPNLFWTVVLLLGFFAWVSAAFVFSVRAIDGQDRWVPAQAKRWGSLIALGFGLFVLGLSLA